MRLRVRFEDGKAHVRAFSNDRRDKTVYSRQVIDITPRKTRREDVGKAINEIKNESRLKMGKQLGLQGLRSDQEDGANA